MGKGGDLTLNTIIIAILVVLVLVSVVVFFMFGFQNVTTKVKGIFQQTSAGTDRNLAIQLCKQYCENFRMHRIEESSYKNVKFNIDDDGDGNIDIKNVHCYELGVTCDNLLDVDKVANMVVIK